ncbi:hypothetical protein VDG1235_1603 [Verrucomicrobiia bacterium DG1235]|nr:hypothetical protein VDG1235_1603 [Verrucomicrobiae bacterium DG1235]
MSLVPDKIDGSVMILEKPYRKTHTLFSKRLRSRRKAQSALFSLTTTIQKML